jgi:hypothetical protein
MGLRTNEALGKKPERCEVETVNCKPYLCAVDEVKAVMGSNFVTVREDERLSAKFSGANGKEVVIKVKKTLVKKYAEYPWEICEEYADEVIRSNDSQHFE